MIHFEKRDQCKICGKSFVWFANRQLNDDGSYHKCVPKVKVYTAEERKELELKLTRQKDSEL